LSLDLLKLPIIKNKKEDKLKTVVNNLLKENQRIVNELEKLRKTDRISQMSKDVINKLMQKIENKEK
jgi:hypothetical protein